MTARNYFYHLAFELYDKLPGPSALPNGAQSNVYLPPPFADIFSADLPEHPKPISSIEDDCRQATKLNTISAKTGNPLHAKGRHKVKASPRHRNLFINFGDKSVDTRIVHITHPVEQSRQDSPTGCQRIEQAAEDWRFERVRVESVKFGADATEKEADMAGASTLGKKVESQSNPTRARVEPLRVQGTKNTELGWGIVHLYREGEERPGFNSAEAGTRDGLGGGIEGEMDKWDTTILCIPAVPSYMTASDFLGWVGERTRDMVSHFRMIMTGKMNRYMMLMKFRDGRDARKWRTEWDGKVFNGMEPENCHVLFIKSITFQTSKASGASTSRESFPDMSCDPFKPILSPINNSAPDKFGLRPLPPPTPALVELPTCPVCLERMDDEITGLLTILCQHVFHCACLQKWRGSGCPVCRHIQPSQSSTLPFGPSSMPNRDINLCHVCDCSEDLWICLICGNVGCGRYKGGHAKEHYKQTAHNYALEIETQYVWDYVEDVWVHRLIQTKGDGKLVELPSHSSSSAMRNGNSGDIPPNMELVPRDKLENMGMEYTHMLTSQLESQRIYFEELMAKTADKAAMSAKAAEESSAAAQRALADWKELAAEHKRMRDEIIPGLERDKERMAAKAEKSSELARSMTKSFQEEKQVSKGLMERIQHLDVALERVRKEVVQLKEENLDLHEQVRDLTFFITSKDKLEKVDGELAEEIREGTMSVPEPPEPKCGKGKKKKGKGKATEKVEDRSTLW